MAQLEPGRVLVGTPGGHVVVRLEGRGSHLNSQPLRDFVMEMVHQGHREFDIDLTACPSVDSTFAGVLVNLSLSVPKGHVVLFGLNGQCQEQLHSLGIVQLFELAIVAPTQPTLEPLPTLKSRDEWAGTIIEAHETLMRVAPENARLRDVLECLMHDKQKRLH